MKRRSKPKSVHPLFFLTVILFWPIWGTGQIINQNFPAQQLTERLGQIAEASKQTITFDAKQLGNIEAPSLDARNKTVEQILAGSLCSSGYAFRQLDDQSYIIYKNQGKTNTDKIPTAKELPIEKGNISGTILDESGETLVGATVMVLNTTIGTTTDMNGHYTLKQVPSGSRTIEVRYISYQTQQIENVKVNAGKITRLNVVLKPVSEEIGEVVIKADYKQASAEGLYARQKAMVAMTDGISADLIKKTSDNNIAQVLKRVAGVSVNKGKYVVVRGMSERYNNTELNGTSLPSTEPNRRNFSFDIIPAALVDNVIVSKTFTPNMPGEFVGGTVQVNTLTVPDKKFFKLSVGSGFNTVSTGKDFWSNKRFSSDYLLGNKRDWNGKEWKLKEYNQYFDANVINNWDGVNTMNAKIPNGWGLQKFTGAPTQNYSFTMGFPFNLGKGNRLGMVAALTYRHEEKTEDLKEEDYRIGGEYMLPNGGGRYKFITATGAIANMGWQSHGHSITWRNLLNNRFTHTNIQRACYTDEQYTYYLEQYSAPLLNRLWQTQLEGKHSLCKSRLNISWMADYNKMNRDQPEDRLARGNIRNEIIDSIPPTDANGQYMVNWSWGANGDVSNFNRGHMMTSNMEETKKNAALNFEYEFRTGKQQQKLKAGYRGTFRESDYSQQYLRPQINNDDDIEGLSLHEYYASESFANGYLYYIPFALNANRKDAYEGDQKLHAAYLMAVLGPFPRLSLTGGVRLEHNKMQVRTIYYDNNLGITDTTVVNKNTDWLPSISMVYNLTGNFNFRASYSKTLARPDFRELTQTQYYNVDDRVSYKSYRAVEQSSTNNYDLRLEWYPGAGEVISISAFYKKFHNPVELIGRISSDAKNYEMLYANLEESTAKGVELNLRKSLGFIAPESFLSQLFLSTNAMYMKANVKYNYEFLTSFSQYQGEEGEEKPEADRDRPLQGLVPYLINTGLAYQGQTLGLAVNYGYTGRRLITGGKTKQKDEYENARDMLDIQASINLFNKRLEIKANASDLLNQAVITYRNEGRINREDLTDDMDYNDGDYILRKYKKGTSYSLSVSYKF